MAKATKQAHIKSVREALRYLRENLDADLREVAEVACMSPFHFARAFKQLTGRSPAEHSRKVRLIRAAIALRTTTQHIGQIAIEAAYADGDAFRTAFRKEFELSPRDYRSQRKQDMRNPFEGASVGFVKIAVSDFARACEFYRETLGLKEDFAVEAYGWAQYATGSVPICLYKEDMGGGGGKPGVDTNIQLRVNDARAAFEQAKEHASDFGEGDDGTVTFTLTDPDGNTIQVAQVG